KPAKYLTSLLNKMDKADAKVTATTHVIPAKLITMAKEVLGERLKLHPNPTSAWYALTNSRLRNNGMTEELVARALDNISRNWKGEIFIDVLVNSLPKYSVMEIKSVGQTRATATKGWLAND